MRFESWEGSKEGEKKDKNVFCKFGKFISLLVISSLLLSIYISKMISKA
jgi:hypothetical protein